MLRTLRLGGLLMLALFASALVAQSGDKAKEKGKGGDDAKFVMKASENDMAEIEMGKLAAKQATHPKVREFGTKMAQDHTKSSEELATIAKKASLTLTKEVGKMHKTKSEKLAKLTGADFDREYMNGQVKAHQEAVMLFKNQAQNGQNEELKAFAAKTLPIIQEHLKMAQEIAGSLGKESK